MSTDDGLEPVEDEEGPEGWRVRLLRQLEGRKWWPRPKLDESDIVPEGALPICPSCVLPHHPLATVCPECGEIVSRYAALFPLPYVWIWGRALQRAVRQPRLSRLVCAGLLVQALSNARDATYLLLASHVREGLYWGIIIIPGIMSLASLAAAFQTVGSVVRRWGTWRDDGEQCAGQGEPSGG